MDPLLRKRQLPIFTLFFLIQLQVRWLERSRPII
jgi:hypothetical protein